MTISEAWIDLALGLDEGPPPIAPDRCAVSECGRGLTATAKRRGWGIRISGDPGGVFSLGPYCATCATDVGEAMYKGIHGTTQWDAIAGTWTPPR
jgi:hypothetical protein